MLLFLIACSVSSDQVRTPGTSAPDASDEVDVVDEVPSETGGLIAPSVVRLPYVTVGQPVPSATFSITATGAHPALSLSVEGPFAVTGETAVLAAGEERTFSVTWTGATDAPANGAGRVLISTEEGPLEVLLAASLGVADLPVNLAWEDDGYGMWTIAAMPSAPYPEPGGAWSDPSVWIWVPHGLHEDSVGVMTHLHGHNASLSSTIAAKSLRELTALSGRNAVFLQPQGPVSYPSGDFGKLDDPGGHAALVRDALAVLYRDGFLVRPELDEVVLSSHSGGYWGVANMVAQGGLDVDAVHLFDSLYGRRDDYQAFIDAGGTFRSNYTTSGGTVDNNQTLRSLVGAHDADDDASLALHDVTIAWTPSSHSAVMADMRNYARWLVHSGLRPHRHAPPELLAVVSDGDEAIVHWQITRGNIDVVMVVEGSDDGQTFTELGRGTGGVLTVPARTHIRLRQVDGDPSDTYAGSGGDWLIVDGFDRVLDGSYSEFTHNFGAVVGGALEAASGASNEAVASGRVSLDAYDGVIWLLGDEGTADRTFDDREMDRISSYVDAGGTLIVSGSEVGYASETSFLGDTLHCTYVSDDAGTTSASGHTFGVAYPEDYPDVLSGQTTLWTYDTGGAAAVGWEERVVVVGFPLETLADVPAGVSSLVDYVR